MATPLGSETTVLGAHIQLRAILHGIEYHDGGAVVAFMIRSAGHKLEEKERFSALVPLGVALNGRTRTDYEKIVADAARRLARDFSHMATDLAETHG